MKFEFDQKELDWSPTQTPVATGKINGKCWTACFIGGRWTLHRFLSDGLLRTETRDVITQLEMNTPSYIERVKARRTKLRRYIIYSGLVTTIIGFVSFVFLRRIKKSRF